MISPGSPDLSRICSGESRFFHRPVETSRVLMRRFSIQLDVGIALSAEKRVHKSNCLSWSFLSLLRNFSRRSNKRLFSSLTRGEGGCRYDANLVVSVFDLSIKLLSLTWKRRSFKEMREAVGREQRFPLKGFEEVGAFPRRRAAATAAAEPRLKWNQRDPSCQRLQSVVLFSHYNKCSRITFQRLPCRNRAVRVCILRLKQMFVRRM